MRCGSFVMHFLSLARVEWKLGMDCIWTSFLERGLPIVLHQDHVDIMENREYL